MEMRGARAVVLSTILVVGLSVTVVYMWYGFPEQVTDNSGIQSLWIIGNTSDILYPELMEAGFTWQDDGGWFVTANFVDDSEGWEEPIIYDRTFQVTAQEVLNINQALDEGLNLTYNSVELLLGVLEMNPHIGFQIDITYKGGEWISLCTFQTEEGHIILMSGRGTPNINLLDGQLLQPVSALDGLVATINQVFQSHLD
ncbi:MAG: hypothetical protein ACW99U_16325 [Candidatus Thorarchaeota archaeon]